MSSPQLQNGFTRLAHELTAAIERADFGKTAIRIVLNVLRRTYGAIGSPKTAPISTDEVAADIGVSPKSVRNVVRYLVEARVLVEERPRAGLRLIGINKDYEKWTVAGAATRKKPKQLELALVSTELSTVPPWGVDAAPHNGASTPSLWGARAPFQGRAPGGDPPPARPAPAPKTVTSVRPSFKTDGEPGPSTVAAFERVVPKPKAIDLAKRIRQKVGPSRELDVARKVIREATRSKVKNAEDLIGFALKLDDPATVYGKGEYPEEIESRLRAAGVDPAAVGPLPSGRSFASVAGPPANLPLPDPVAARAAARKVGEERREREAAEADLELQRKASALVASLGANMAVKAKKIGGPTP